MLREVLVLSVRPVFVGRILGGLKKVELRRVRPLVKPGTGVLIYSSSPTMALAAMATVDRTDMASVQAIWDTVSQVAGVSKKEYADYYSGADVAVAIWLSQVSPLERPLGLRELRARWPWFRPPQSYCYVGARFDRARRRLLSLEPRSRPRG